jgi:hypothetical protein
MVLKHIPSNADLDILIDDNGNLFIFCRQINKVWADKLEAYELPTSVNKAVGTPKALKLMASTSRATLEEIGMDASAIDSLLGQ